MRKTVTKAINKFIASGDGKKNKRALIEKWHKTPRPVRHELRLALLKQAGE